MLPRSETRGRQRPARAALDPWLPQEVVFEEERSDRCGALVNTMTVFLSGAECPFPCLFCDLWQHTILGPTPPGALPAQLSIARARLKALGQEPGTTVIKLYNASNFFEDRAVPEVDDELVIEQVADFLKVVVECHPRLVGERAFLWAQKLRDRGSQLEVAMGFETAHPDVFARLQKKASLDDLRTASEKLREFGASVRAFLLVGVPFLAMEEQASWVARSVRFASDCGASIISLIPLRENQELARLRRQGLFEPPTLELVQEALEASLEELTCLEGAAVLLVDLWDIERLLGIDREAGRQSLARLERFNRSGEW